MNRMGAGWTVALAGLAVTGLALAATSPEPARVETALPGGGMLAQLTLGLVIVLAAAVGLSWLLRRYALPRGGAIQVIGGLPLGSRERLLLIEVDRVRLLIGVTASQIQALHVFPATASAAAPVFTLTPSTAAETVHDRPSA